MNKENFLKEKISNAFYKLMQKVEDKACKIDVYLVKKALDLVDKAHRKWLKVFDNTGFFPPIEVAKIVIDLGMDTKSIVIALLYDTIGGKEVTYKDIKDNFGSEIADMVQDLAKLHYIENTPFFNQNEKKAEDYENLLYAILKDIRVLIVKLADRLHNMRTLHYIPNVNKKKKIALETLEIYAALAERMGIRNLKEELQDLSFIELYPEKRKEILIQIDHLRKGHEDLINNTEKNLKNMLSSCSLDFFEVSGREKKPYSVWKKLENERVHFQDLFDIFAFRIVTKNQDDCYRALRIIHAQYCCIQEKFADYISMPKSNNYQSLHTVVITPTGQKIEIQIRDKEMHRTAEFGSAAHWRYKSRITNIDNKKTLPWIDEILSIVQNSCTASESITNIKLAISYYQIFCFTPQGKVVLLNKEATVLDFGFYVDLSIALRCTGAIINGRNVPIWHKLKDGDIVQITYSDKYTVSKVWNEILCTGKAKAELSAYLNTKIQESKD